MSKLKIGVFGAYRGMGMIHVLLEHPDGNIEYGDEVFEKVRQMWLDEKNN